ncbi:MAG TPA: MFS transporter [Gaiellaceae bacterium]|nr:MFS transporter [Gaiellaceae bacterium]
MGGCLTWNVSNVGAVADPLAQTYGVSLAAIGLLTTSLFVTHLLVQLPAGHGADRYGARAVALAAVVATLVGNALLLLDHSFTLGLLGRAVVGLGSGAAFVAGLDLVRAGGGGPLQRGLYGGATMLGGGLAVMVLPALTDATSWRAPYWSAIVLALAAAVPLLAASGLPRVGRTRARVATAPGLVPLGLLQGATFGLAVVAGNWVVPLLERHGYGAVAAGLAGGLILSAGILTRPVGGMLTHTRARSVVLVGLLGVCLGSAILALPLPIGVLTLGALVLGLGAGLPFAVIFTGAQRLRLDAPGAAVGLVNAISIVVVLVATPLAGLAFDLPGDGRLAFAGIAACAAAALLLLRRAALGRDNRPPEHA